MARKSCLIVRLNREGCIRKYACPFFILHLHRHALFAIINICSFSFCRSIFSTRFLSVLHFPAASGTRFENDPESGGGWWVLDHPRRIDGEVTSLACIRIANVKSSSKRKFGGTELLSSYLIPWMPKKEQHWPRSFTVVCNSGAAEDPSSIGVLFGPQLG